MPVHAFKWQTLSSDTGTYRRRPATFNSLLLQRRVHAVSHYHHAHSIWVLSEAYAAWDPGSCPGRRCPLSCLHPAHQKAVLSPQSSSQKRCNLIWSDLILSCLQWYAVLAMSAGLPLTAELATLAHSARETRTFARQLVRERCELTRHWKIHMPKGCWWAGTNKCTMRVHGNRSSPKPNAAGRTPMVMWTVPQASTV